MSDHGSDNVGDLKEIGTHIIFLIILAKNADNLIAILKNIKNAVKNDDSSHHHEVSLAKYYNLGT